MDKIICVGKNYLDHALELGDQVPDKPVLFIKPPSVLKQATRWGDHVTAQFPENDTKVQPECEIVLLLSKDGYCLTHEEASHSIEAVSLGLDMTLRAHQTNLKKQGHPWTTAKVFPDAAIVGPWISYTSWQDYINSPFELQLEEQVSQRAKGSDMMMEPVALLVYISQFFYLKAGDMVYTGTPAGVRDIKRNTTARLCWDKYHYTVIWT